MKIAITITSPPVDGEHAVLWNDEPSHQIAVADVEACLNDAIQGDWRKNPASGATLGARLFRMLNGSGGQLEAALKQAALKGEQIDLALHLPFELDALPFELLCSPTPNPSQEGNPLLGGVRGGFILLTHNLHLIRRVNERNRLKPESPPKRPLSVLFIACSPRNLPERDMLDFEREEERILNMVERLRVELRIEDSGSLPGLEEMLIEMGGGCDIVHLTGHAGIDHELGPVFYMEDDVGDRQKVTPAQLWNTVQDFPPRFLFLSGCSTGKSDQVNASASFAYKMVDQGIPVVLGWGLPVADIGATQMATVLYEQLGKGKDVATAVQRARRELADQYHPWPLLRVFSDGSPSAPSSAAQGDSYAFAGQSGARVRGCLKSFALSRIM